MIQDRNLYFMLAYEAPTFSAAAAKVPMSPQGFTKAIRNMEKELGVPLFAVNDDGVKNPTPYAVEYYEYAKRVRVEQNLLASAFERIASSGYVELRVACSLGVPGLLGYNFLKAFELENPEVSISLHEMPDALCESLLRDGLYDLSIIVTPTVEEFKVIPLYSSQVLYWVNCSDEVSEKEVLHIEDFEERAIAIPGDDFKCSRDLLSQFDKAGLKAPEIVKYSEIFWIYEFVLKNRGLGFTLPHLSRLSVFNSQESICARPLEGSTWQFGVAYLGSRVLSVSEQKFASFLQAKTKQLKH